MLIFYLIISRKCAPSALPSAFRPPFPLCCLFFLPPTQSPEVTKSPVVHPLSIQQLTRCSSPNSFVLITTHFDGSVHSPDLRRRTNPCSRALLRARGKQDAAFYWIVS